MNTERTLTLWQVIGTPMSVLSAVTFLMLLGLLIVGINARVRRRDTFPFAWWTASLSGWILVAGVIALAGHLMNAFARLGSVTLPSDILNRLLAEGFARLFIGAVVALFGLSVRMLLGTPKRSEEIENRQPERPGDGSTRA